jgi:hypothetical protein
MVSAERGNVVVAEFVKYQEGLKPVQAKGHGTVTDGMESGHVKSNGWRGHNSNNPGAISY